MNTEFMEIYSMFLSSITNFDEYANYTDEEICEELSMFLRRAMAKFVTSNNIVADYDLEEFNRELSDLEKDILASGILVEYLKPKVHSIELMRQHLAMKDYSIYSQAKQLSELKLLLKDAEANFNHWVNRYSFINRSQESKEKSGK